MTSAESDRTRFLRSSAIMALGTIFSRLSGFLRAGLLLAALGTSTQADVFNVANTIPNMLYILLAGGVFNAVLVPQLVRAMKHDADGGEAYAQRIITLAALFLGLVTILLVVAAPLVMRVVLSQDYFTPELAPARETAIAFARYCLPQVFFYGMFVLLGQILNSRGRFGPMMWAPIANNAIAVGVLVTYLLVFGPLAPGVSLGLTSDQELLLGLGSTAGIVVQFLILIPVLRSAGFRYRPRFDFRGVGLGQTARLGAWTVGFVMVNQISYTVVMRVASGATADGGGAGFTVYSTAYLVMLAPHSIITVSLLTAALPTLSRLAADHEFGRMGHELAAALRSALALIVPFVVLIPVIALPLANITTKYGAAAASTETIAWVLVSFSPGLLFFTIHFAMLRGFYALERNRTVFFNQCLLAGVNVVLAVALTYQAPPDQIAARLALAYAGAYLVGSASSYRLLQRHTGHLDTRRLIRFLVRLGLACGLAAALAAGAVQLLLLAWPENGGKVQALVWLGLAGLIYLTLFLAFARRMRIREVSELTDVVTRRLRR